MTNVFFIKRENKKSNVTSLRCYFHKKNSINDLYTTSSCPFQMKYKISGDNVQFERINCEHNHALLQSKDYEELQLRSQIHLSEDSSRDLIKQDQDSTEKAASKIGKNKLQSERRMEDLINKYDNVVKKIKIENNMIIGCKNEKIEEIIVNDWIA